MYRKLSIAAALLCTQSLATYAASDVTEGNLLYQQFRCADCHGTDAKKPFGKYNAILAGMNPDEVYMKTRRFVESRSHEQVLQGCGEPPSHIQIKKISDYLATLPK